MEGECLDNASPQAYVSTAHDNAHNSEFYYRFIKHKSFLDPSLFKLSILYTFVISGEEPAQDPTNRDLVSKSEELYKELVEKKKTAEEVGGSDIFQVILCHVLEEQKRCRAGSRTVALWLQYSDMVDIVRAFLKAERTGNWEMHLQVVSQILPYFPLLDTSFTLSVLPCISRQ